MSESNDAYRPPAADLDTGREIGWPVPAIALAALLALAALWRLVGVAQLVFVLTRLPETTRMTLLEMSSSGVATSALLGAAIVWFLALFLRRRRSALIPWTLYVVAIAALFAFGLFARPASPTRVDLVRLTLELLIPFLGLLYALRLDRRGFLS